MFLYFLRTIQYFLMKFYTDVLGITLTVHPGACSSISCEPFNIFSWNFVHEIFDVHYTNILYSYHLLLCWGPFGVFLDGLFFCIFLYFLRTFQYFLMNFCTDFFGIILKVTTLKKISHHLSLMGSMLEYLGS